MPFSLPSRRTTALGLILAVAIAGIGAMGKQYAKFDADGRLIRPEGYREWVFIGTPLTPNDMNGGKAAFPEFHHVYIDPKSYDVYQKTGEFRDGTILVKELVSVGSKLAASGKGYFAGEFIGLEATVKSASRFADQPGGWAYFRFTNERTPDGHPLADRSPAMPVEACNSCHGAAAEQDWVFTQYYPVLDAVRPDMASAQDR